MVNTENSRIGLLTNKIRHSLLHCTTNQTSTCHPCMMSASPTSTVAAVATVAAAVSLLLSCCCLCEVSAGGGGSSSSSSSSSTSNGNVDLQALLSSMSLLEKARQLDMYFGSQDLLTNGELDMAKVEAVVGDGNVGVIHDLYAPGNSGPQP